MSFLWYVIFAVLGLALILSLVYFLLLQKLRRLNIKLYKRKVETNLKNENVLIVYQPSRRGTINKIVDNIKESLQQKQYGYVTSTLSNINEDYNNYKYTIFVMPVYFGEVHARYINIVNTTKIKNLLIVYNGLNLESNNEDKNVKNSSLSIYKKIKLHTTDIELVKEFINKEVK